MSQTQNLPVAAKMNSIQALFDKQAVKGQLKKAIPKTLPSKGSYG